MKTKRRRSTAKGENCERGHSRLTEGVMKDTSRWRTLVKKGGREEERSLVSWRNEGGTSWEKRFEVKRSTVTRPGLFAVVGHLGGEYLRI